MTYPKILLDELDFINTNYLYQWSLGEVSNQFSRVNRRPIECINYLVIGNDCATIK